MDAFTPSNRSSRIQNLLQHRHIHTKQAESTGNQHRKERTDNVPPEFSSDEDEDEDVPILQSEGDLEKKVPEQPKNLKSIFALENAQQNDDEELREVNMEEHNLASPNVSDLQQRHDQLQEDVDVLVVHLEKQTLEIDNNRAIALSVQQHLYHIIQTTERELHNVRLENESLRRQNTQVLQERDDLRQQLIASSSTQEELLYALKAQQQRDEQARVLVMNSIKERDVLRKQLDESKSYCRQLEEEIVTTRAESERLLSENSTLQAITKVATNIKNDRETKLIREQSHTIESLRDDLLQMEFAYKTLLIDKDKQNARIKALERAVETSQQSRRHDGYDVISLTSDGENGKKKRLSLTSRNDRNDKTKGNGFTDLMSLPNCISDSPDTMTTISINENTQPISRGSISLVAKTFSSAKKKLFHSSAQSHVVVLPQ